MQEQRQNWLWLKSSYHFKTLVLQKSPNTNTHTHTHTVKTGAVSNARTDAISGCWFSTTYAVRTPPPATSMTSPLAKQHLFSPTPCTHLPLLSGTFPLHPLPPLAWCQQNFVPCFVAGNLLLFHLTPRYRNICRDYDRNWGTHKHTHTQISAHTHISIGGQRISLSNVIGRWNQIDLWTICQCQKYFTHTRTHAHLYVYLCIGVGI